MDFKIFDNDIACLLLTELKEPNVEVVKSEDNKVFFNFLLEDKSYKEAMKLIEKYEEKKLKVNIKKYNENRRILLKKISILKKHNNCLN